MAKVRKGIDGLDEVIGLFPPGSHRMLERLLKRAAERRARAAGHGVEAAMRSALSGGRGGAQVGVGLASELAKALRQRGDIGGGKASIRKTAPDTGGRPFHFAHSVVSKADAAAPAASGRAAKPGQAAAHMRYIERELAVETTYEAAPAIGAASLETDGPARDGGKSRDDGSWDRVLSPDAASRVHATGAAAAQGYVENPAKLANGEGIVFSFGTIGDRFEDRVAFWEALEEAERHPSARVQNRLIVELPHEASPEARFEMVRTFCSRFVGDGVPFWAALHAPGKGNDDRNFHAHVVFSERPARRMVDPADGATKWDFAISSTYRKKSRNTVTTRPYIRSKLRAYTAWSFIPTLRKEFSDVVNAVLERDGVKGKDGADVRYDARSYNAMGVDVVPMRSINRIVADKMRDGTTTVLDGDYTRRMVAAEIREAAVRREPEVMALLALDDALRAAAAAGKPQRENARLPKELRASPLAMVSKAALGVAARRIMAARHEALQVDVMEKATVASLERIVAATAPRAVQAAARKRDPVARREAPSSEGAALLHAAALEELATTQASTAEARRSIRYRVGSAVNEWRALVGAPPPETTPAMRATLRAVDERETAAAQAAAAASGRDATARSQQPEGRSAGKARGASAGVGDRARARGEAAMPPAVPKTAADALAIAMPPTTADLAAASRTVSSWIRIIAEGEPDVDRRMARLDAFMVALKEGAASIRQGLRSRTTGEASPAAAVIPVVHIGSAGSGGGLPRTPPSRGPDVRATVPAGPASRDRIVVPATPAAPTSAVPPTMPAEPVTPKSPAAPVASVASYAPATPATPVTPAKRGASAKGPGSEGKVEGSGPRSAEAGSRGPGRDEGEKVSAPAPEDVARRMPVPRKEDATTVGEARRDAPGAPQGAAQGAAPEPEHPDDTKRRKKRENEEKRRKMRKAVLGRQNRGRSR